MMSNSQSGRRAGDLLKTSHGPTLTAANRSDMDWASFITTYNRPEVLRSTIEAVFSQSMPPSTLLIVDNGTDPMTVGVVADFDDERLLYVSTGENLGSAGGCAFGLKWLAERGFKWINSIDDDDPPRIRHTMERLRALIERQDCEELGGVAAVGSRWNWATGQFDRLPDHELRGDVCVDTFGGNSLLTIRRSAIETIGTPEPQFFFGFYDPLYCLRLGRAGFRLMIDGDLMREHRDLAGRLELHRQRRLIPNDPVSGVWRRYYVTRNYIYRMRESFDRPDLARREALRALCAVLRRGCGVRGTEQGTRHFRSEGSYMGIEDV